MQRLNRSTSAPKSTAFLLFLGLAMVPFSLKAAGFQVNFSPSLSAAANAWQQIADVFGSGYQPAREFDLSAPGYTGGEQLRAVDTAACPGRKSSCADYVDQSFVSVEHVSQVSAQKAAAVRGACPKTACSKIALRARTTCFAEEPALATAVTGDSLQKQVQALQVLGAVKVEMLTHAEWLKNDGPAKNIERSLVERRLAIPQNFMVLLHLKSQVIPSATRAAQCKVRAAMDSARKVELERAILTGLSSAGPDNCEL